MENPNKYYFSEHEFGGFYNLEISWDEEGVQAEYFVPEEAVEAYQLHEDRLQAEEFITGGHYSQPDPFFIHCKGTDLAWQYIEKVKYYEIKQANRYGFRIVLQGRRAEEEIVIAAKTAKDVGTTQPLKATHANILDNIEIENPFFKEKNYLQAMYNALIEVLEPLATEVLVKRYTRRLKTNQTIRIGKLEVHPQGIFLKKKGWIRKKSVLVDWESLESTYDKGKLWLIDDYEDKVKLVIDKYDLINKDAIAQLIVLGKKGDFN